MGYYSTYQVSIFDRETMSELGFFEAEPIAQALGQMSDDAAEAMEGGATKWYNWVDETKEFSVNYPDLVFLVGYIGEDSERVSYWFYRGKHHDANVRFIQDPFSEGKLK